MVTGRDCKYIRVLEGPYECGTEVGLPQQNYFGAQAHCCNRMVKERIQTALIIEDDADWDVMIKSQLVEFARGTRFLQDSQAGATGPYGDDWDLLWLGHCGAKNRDWEDQKYYIIQDDHTAVSVTWLSND